MRTYPVYRLLLPSGAVVRVRKNELAFLASGALMLFPLLAAAFDAAPAAPDDENSRPPEAPAPFVGINTICRAALVEPDIRKQVDAMPLLDRMAIAGWATVPGVIEPAVYEGERPWTRADFEPLIRGRMVTLIDLVCSRYGMIPSVYLQLSDTDFALDFDCAVAYRGARRENDSSSVDGEVEVEDMYGNKIRVPQSILPTAGIDPEARVMHADSIARRYGETVMRGGGDPAGQITGSALH